MVFARTVPVKGPDTPPRPSIPPAFLFALGLWGAAACACEASFSLSFVSSAVLAVGCAIVSILLCFILVRSNKYDCALSVCLAIAIGASLAFGWGSWQHALQMRLESTESQDVRLLCVSDASLSSRGSSYLARMVDGPYKGAMVRLFVSNDEGSFRYGGSLLASVNFEALEGDTGLSAWRKGACIRAYTQNPLSLKSSSLISRVLFVRNAIIDSCERSSNAQGAALAEALLCGYRVNLFASDSYDAFKIAGLAHLVAVSGSHLALVVSLLEVLFRTLGIRRRSSLAIKAIVLLAYLVLTGMPLSALRSAVMVFLASASGLFGRRSAPLNALAACIVAFVAMSVSTSLSISFLLSCASMTGIILFLPLFRWWFSCLGGNRMKWLSDSLAITLSSSIVTAPVAAALFAQYSIISPVSNVVMGVVFMPVFISLLVLTAASLLVAPAQPILVTIACKLASLLCWLVSRLARIPYAQAYFDIGLVEGAALSAVGCFALWVFWSRAPLKRIAFCLVVALALAFGSNAFNTAFVDRVVMLDVGQGDSFLLQSNGQTMLLDTGCNDELLMRALARNEVHHLERVVITHSDQDHMGSLLAFMGAVQVDEVFLFEDALSCPCSSCESLRESALKLVTPQNLKPLSLGETFDVGDISLEVVWPSSYKDQGGNADSVCLHARYACQGADDGFVDILFTGDAERDELRKIIEQRPEMTVDILKVGHHGSRVSLSSDIAAQLSPEVALISVGEGNSYGHPAEETIAFLEQAGVAIHRTDEEGDVALWFNNHSVRLISD